MSNAFHLLQSGIFHRLALALSLTGMLLAIPIWIMEFSGWTITRRGFRRNQVSWDATNIALVAVTAALYIAGRPFQFQLIPGVGGINPSFSFAPVFAVLFGLPGAIGVTFSMPIGDALSGALTVGSIGGFLSHTFLTWLPYKMVREPNFKNWRAVASFYFWAVLVGPLIHSIIIPGWLDFNHVLPTPVAWGALPLVLILNHCLTPAIVAPLLMTVMYPVVKARGLYWRDRKTSSFLVDPSLRRMLPKSDSSLPVPVLVVDDLHFKYGNAREEALRGVSFSVFPGEFVGITGPSGAGKSTLALCLRGLIPHVVAGEMKGAIFVDGQDTCAVAPSELGERVGLVFQDPEAQIIGLTVAEDLAFSPENYEWERERILAATPPLLELVKMSGTEERDTFGLSGGQKQRVTLASALMLAPDLLVLDEPTSELDPLGREQVFEALRGLRAGRKMTILVIEHAVEQLADFCDRILVMDHGCIVAEGAPEQVFRNMEVFHRSGGERVPAAAELIHSLEVEGLVPAGQFGLSEAEASRAVSMLLDNSGGVTK